MPSGSARLPTICARSRHGPMPAAWLGSNRRRPSGARRIDAGGEIARRPRLAIMLQRPADRGERELAPWDLLPVEEPDLETFRSGLDRLVEQPGTIDQLHLADPRDVINRQQSFDLDSRPGFLPGLALSAGARRFVELEIAGRQGPVAVARVDRTAAQ